MQKKMLILIIIMLSPLFFTACSNDPQVIQFKNDMDTFCSEISSIDLAMNNIDATSENARTELLRHLGNLDNQFKEFSGLDFPKEFDYLEPLADEASNYMTEAVAYYHKTYADEGIYNEIYEEYATENYSRAWKRIQILISFLHGDEPEDVTLE